MSKGGKIAVPVKLSDIVNSISFQTDESSYYLNRETGDIIHVMNQEFRAAEEEDDSSKELYGLEDEQIEIANDILADELQQKYIALPDKFDIHEYNIMERFCLSIEDEDISDSLYRAIKGRGAFRRFKDAIYRYGVADDWYKYRDNAMKSIAIDWCEEKGIEYIED
jgi:hypothetical protein